MLQDSEEGPQLVPRTELDRNNRERMMSKHQTGSWACCANNVEQKPRVWLTSESVSAGFQD